MQYKCQKCGHAAVVHLTELAKNAAGVKQTIELHLCAHHAVEAGVLSPTLEQLGGAGLGASAIIPVKSGPRPGEPGAAPGAIVPASPGALAATRGGSPPEALACPHCGMTWHQFKSGGLMGCPHDYGIFEARLLPVIARSQENASEHVGKAPRHMRAKMTREVDAVRLKNQLQRALEAENYEQAARLRDQLNNAG